MEVEIYKYEEDGNILRVYQKFEKNLFENKGYMELIPMLKRWELAVLKEKFPERKPFINVINFMEDFQGQAVFETEIGKWYVYAGNGPIYKNGQVL